MSLSCTSLHSFGRRLSPAACLLVSVALSHPSFGQSAASKDQSFLALASLPDSPGTTLSNPPPAGPDSAGSPGYSSSSSSLLSEPTLTADGATGAAAAGQNLGLHSKGAASVTDKYIDPGQQAPRLTSGDKVRLGLRDAVSPFAAVGWMTSAAYSQAVDSSPNYGQGWGPFAQRFGATAARASTEGVFSDSLFAPIFHEDPRYYRLGPEHNVVRRTVYAVTRTIITRSDDGRATPNFALISGNAAGSILTNAYYPDRNRNVKDTFSTFGGSVGGSAIGFFVSEFLSDALGIVHLKKSE